MFGKIMSLHDDLIIKYFDLCTDVPSEEIHEIEEGLRNGDNPRNAKAYLAREIVKLYHSVEESSDAEKEFENVFKKGNKPDDIVTKKMENGKWKIDELLYELDLVPSKSEARRVVEQGGVKIEDKVIKDWKQSIEVKSGTVVQVGKRKFVKIK
jgi:tyrosyl-tRNA synthetase